MNQRPELKYRKFISPSIDNFIEEVVEYVADKELGQLFENCFPNTLDTTINFKEENGNPSTFVITGDINAMWLRDSSAQVNPYIPFAKQDRTLRKMLFGVVNKQVESILLDPYANAFNNGPTGSEWEKDYTEMKPELHERKWEIDSLCYPVRLAYNLWKVTEDFSFFKENFRLAAEKIIATFKEQQRKEE